VVIIAATRENTNLNIGLGVVATIGAVEIVVS
jgi:uncharacterized protein (UPF0254 family)